MPPIKIQKIESALNRKGFRKEPGGKKHIFYRFYYKGKKTTVHTHYSHGETEIGDHLISSMAKQIELTKSQFYDYVKCDICENEYIGILSQKGILD